MKECRICHIEKPLDAFYAHPSMSGGVDSKCKECAKAGVRANYFAKREQYQEYERGRAMLPHRVALRQIYGETKTGRQKKKEARFRWTAAHPIQFAATKIVASALKRGHIKKDGCCSECKKVTKRLEGHHDDYAHPLVVRWLCRKCHYDWHQTNEPLNGD
jgi:hypothetical protein